jgi:hypothetical protein
MSHGKVINTNQAKNVHLFTNIKRKVFKRMYKINWVIYIKRVLHWKVCHSKMKTRLQKIFHVETYNIIAKLAQTCDNEA